MTPEPISRKERERWATYATGQCTQAIVARLLAALEAGEALASTVRDAQRDWSAPDSESPIQLPYYHANKLSMALAAWRARVQGD